MTAALMHATCIAIGGRGVLLLGPSGSGKSDLALRLIDGGATLVADDQVQVESAEGMLIASAPQKLRGLIEARGIGILTLESLASVSLSLAVQLVARDTIERLPEPARWSCHGVDLQLLSLHAFDASAAAKIRLALLPSS